MEVCLFIFLAMVMVAATMFAFAGALSSGRRAGAGAGSGRIYDILEGVRKRAGRALGDFQAMELRGPAGNRHALLRSCPGCARSNSQHYTGVGEVQAVHALDHTFGLLRRQIRVKRGSLLSLDDVKNNDTIFVGSQAENLTCAKFPAPRTSSSTTSILDRAKATWPS